MRCSQYMTNVVLLAHVMVVLVANFDDGIGLGVSINF